MATTFDDETVMAYADGVATVEQSRAIEAALVSDPELARRVDMFRATATMARQSMVGVGGSDVPDKLAAAIKKALAEDESSNVVPFVRRSGQSPGWLALPLAASIAAVVAGAAGFVLGLNNGSPGQQPDFAALGGTVWPQISAILNEKPSGSSTRLPGGRLDVIASFRTPDSAICREFEFDRAGHSATISVACHEEEGWSIRLAVVAPPGSDGYAPASSRGSLESYLLATGAGEPMSEADEAAVLKALR